MEDAQRREIALFRYALVRQAADPALTNTQRGRLVCDLAGRDHAGPDGQRRRVARSTIDEWIRAYRTGGFDGLVPAPGNRQPRTAAEVLALAVSLKEERPGRTAAQIRQVMLAAGHPAPSARTIQRHFRRTGHNRRPDGSLPAALTGGYLTTRCCVTAPRSGSSRSRSGSGPPRGPDRRRLTSSRSSDTPRPSMSEPADGLPSDLLDPARASVAASGLSCDEVEQLERNGPRALTEFRSAEQVWADRG